MSQGITPLDPQKFLRSLRDLLHQKENPTKSSSSPDVPSDLRSSSALRGLSPIYILYGEESFLIQEAGTSIQEIAKRGENTEEGLSLSTHYANQMSFVNFREEMETLSFLYPRKIAWIRDVHLISDVNWKILYPILKNPVESTVLILSGSKIDRRRHYAKILETHATFVEFKKPQDRHIPGWIEHYAKRYSLFLGDREVALFHHRVGNELEDIHEELRKLSEYLSGSPGMSPESPREVCEEDIKTCVSFRREETVFAFIDDIGLGDFDRALHRGLRLRDQNPIGIVALLGRHMRILLLLHQGRQRGLTGPSLAQWAEIPPYFLEKYTRQIRLWSHPKLLEEALVLVGQTDLNLKSSSLDPNLWLTHLVFQLNHLLRPQSRLRSSP